MTFGGSGLIRGMTFGGSDLIRGMIFGGSGLIRGMTFGGSGLIRGMTFGGSGLIRGGLLYQYGHWTVRTFDRNRFLAHIPNSSIKIYNCANKYHKFIHIWIIRHLIKNNIINYLHDYKPVTINIY
jgi:hypothetical protein